FEKRKCVSRVEDEERLRRLADARRGDLTKYSAGLARFLSNGFLEVPLDYTTSAVKIQVRYLKIVPRCDIIILSNIRR
ncbi:MAG: hypothetical protein J6N15_10825, partial [Ruminiclostridium sp.]|nr:hypothetical protein [Ruminiclostridium sp.]